MKKFLIGIGIVASISVIGVSLNSYATPQQDMNCEAIKNENYTPAYFQMTGEQALNESEAIEKFKKAELGYLCANDNENAQKVREQLANVDKMNFSQNRREKMMILQEKADFYRENGDNDTANKFETKIEEIKKMNREDSDKPAIPQ